MTKKTLQAWYNDGEINYSQKEIINKFGVDDYYPEYASRDLKKLWYWNSILKRNVWVLGNNFSNEWAVCQMSFFSTWWNNNLILVISDIGGGSYFINLIIYEMPHREMREILEVISINIIPSSLERAKNSSREIARKLNGENPILYNDYEKLSCYYYDDHNSSAFPFLFSKGEVKRVEVDFNSARWNPDAYFKPLDITMICNNEWVHTCVYLGNNKICHALNGNQVRIGDWNSFFILLGANKMLRYHPLIAFKETNEIIKHIANCAEGQETYYSPRKKEKFSLYKNNCENFTNRCVLGLDFSQLAEKLNEREKGTPRKTELNIEEQLNKTKSDLDALTNYNTPWSKINEIKECRQGSGYENFDIMRDGISMQASVEVQPKSSIFKDIIREQHYINNNEYTN